MIKRHSWLERIETLWRKKSVLWLSGVRRAGKTVLCQSLSEAEYFDCELPRVRRELADPEEFLRSLRGRRQVLDEIHRLGNPSKRGHEMDFVWVRRGRPPLGIECKWSAGHFNPEAAQAFARAYPQAEIVVVSKDVERTFRRKVGDAEITFLGLPALIERLMA